ncbi:THAP-type domain-containing protein [Aphis craccivora]|uniref:THAP-type domain-containing protein n=1 Tax=Aphis craccivora TaxID=307492 RepID=A0A6G0Y8X5_APHCR|nr:THAP-type domain-containing protein [Aphis craccivora]
MKDPSIHLHSFPKDEKLCEKWAFQITKGTKIKINNCRTAVVCTKHFSKSDIIEKTDIQKAAGYSPERARRLKANAIPLSIHGSSYLSTPTNYANNNVTKVTTPSGTFKVTNEDANNRDKLSSRFSKTLKDIFSPTQIEMLLNPKKKVFKWTSDDISSAISIRSISPKAYRFFETRKIFLYPVCLSTLRMSAAKFLVEPGILSSVICYMKAKGIY